MLSALGFPILFIHMTVYYSVLVNRIPMKPFLAKKGLRQGDPLSPYVFALSMENISRCMSALEEDTTFQYHPKCKRVKLNHLLFVDDLLLFFPGVMLDLLRLS